MLTNIFWALVISTQPYVSEVYRTYEPCGLRVEELKQQYIVAACIPTNMDTAADADKQLRALAQIIHSENTNVRNDM
jgi:hypothetical protein